MSNEHLRGGCQQLGIPSRCGREALIQRIRVYNHIKTERMDDEESEGENAGLLKKDDWLGSEGLCLRGFECITN